MKNKIWFLVLYLLGGCFPLMAQNYHIGDLITNQDGSKGIVFYVNAERTGGWMVALTDASGQCAWGTTGNIPSLQDHTIDDDLYLYLPMLNELDGYSNTQKIRAYQNNSTQYAAGRVNFSQGWYLPSAGQLRILFSRLPLIESAIQSAGGTKPNDNKSYWSSTEFDTYYACIVKHNASRLTGGYLHQEYKTNTTSSTGSSSCPIAVRAIRDFTMTGPATYLWQPNGETTTSITVSPETTTPYSVTVTVGGEQVSDQHTLIVHPTYHNVTTATVCEPFFWDGDYYTTSGHYIHSYQTPYGCDSVLELNLVFTGISSLTIIKDPDEDAYCEGEEITLTANAVIPNPGQINPGDILCTDNSIVKPSDWPVAGKTPKGIVFYVDDTEMHGWALGLQPRLVNGSLSIKWSTSSTDILGLTNYTHWLDAITDFNGYSNTQIIRNAGPSSQYPAAWAVDFENGWYLPSEGQLNVLFSEILKVNPSLTMTGGVTLLTSGTNSTYDVWSSTESSDSKAMMLRNGSTNNLGLVGYDTKTLGKCVRQVIDF